MGSIFDTIKLDRSSSISLYIQLYEQIKEKVEGYILLPGTKLSSVRQTAKLLDINRMTVVSAFKRLENEGFVYTVAGSGTYVANLPVSAGGSLSEQNTIPDELYDSDDISLISGGQIKISENTINFASATPSTGLFPVDNFKAALNEVLERDKGNAFGYHDSQGFYPVREALADMLFERNIQCAPHSLQVMSGAQQGIDIIAKTFLSKDDCVVTESPTYSGAAAVFKLRGAKILDIEMFEDGPELSILEYTIKKNRPRLVYTIPSFQNPTGYSYSAYKREQLLKMADKYDFYIIEDDYVSELDFSGLSNTPLKALDKNDRVIFIKSFSKLFMPGLRIGFIIVPKKFEKSILQAKHTTDISTSGLIQRAFDLYIRKAFLKSHFDYMYDIYMKRYKEMIKALDRELPDSVSYKKPGGGLSIWLKMPSGFPVNRLLKEAAARNIVFAPGHIFYSSNALHKLDNIRLSFASVEREQISQSIETLCKLIKGIMAGGKPDSSVPIL
jgi:2-aminoadipate transaminase